MGAFCGGRFDTENEVENFIRDTIYNLKIKNHNFDDIVAGYKKYGKTTERHEDNTIIIEKSLAESDYNNILREFFIDEDAVGNSFSRYHKALVPTYEDLAKIDFEYSLYENALSVVFGERKYEHVDAIVKSHDQLNFETLTNFIYHYVDTNIRIWTHKIIKAIEQTPDRTVIGDYEITPDFKSTARRLAAEFSSRRTRLLADRINTEVDVIIRTWHKDATNENIKQELINQHDLHEINDVFPWLFDALQLREYYWNHYVLENK